MIIECCKNVWVKVLSNTKTGSIKIKNFKKNHFEFKYNNELPQILKSNSIYVDSHKEIDVYIRSLKSNEKIEVDHGESSISKHSKKHMG